MSPVVKDPELDPALLCRITLGFLAFPLVARVWTNPLKVVFNLLGVRLQCSEALRHFSSTIEEFNFEVWFSMVLQVLLVFWQFNNLIFRLLV